MLQQRSMKYTNLSTDLTLQVEPTRACNLNCLICLRPNIKAPHNYFMSLENFQIICDAAISSKTFQYIGLHGWGEPLLNYQIFDMVRYAENKGLATNLTTNGILVNKRMKEIFASGLQQIAIGVYDLRLLREVVPGIAELIKIKNQRGLKIPKTYLDITICEKSFPYIQNFIQTAHEIGINALIFHRLFNVYKTDPSVKYISSAKEKMLFANVKEMATKMGMEIYLPARHSYPCKVVRYSIFVTVDGEITPCCFLPEYQIGNALEMELEGVLTSESYRIFVEEMANYPICGRCIW